MMLKCRNLSNVEGQKCSSFNINTSAAFKAVMEDIFASLKNFYYDEKSFEPIFVPWNKGKSGTYNYDITAKKYIVELPDKQIIKIKNLSKFCKDNNLNVGHLHETLSGKRTYCKGYKLLPQTKSQRKKYRKERIKRKDTTRKGLPGEKNGRAILNWDKVNQIRELHASKTHKNQDIANMFGIKKVTLEKIVSNKLWTV